jgi:hypothetical protein
MTKKNTSRKRGPRTGRRRRQNPAPEWEEYVLVPPMPGWPEVKVTEIGRGPYCYVRASPAFEVTVFRFATEAETYAAMQKGAELDEVGGVTPELVGAIRKAASEAVH